jgi:hypothetical protein
MAEIGQKIAKTDKNNKNNSNYEKISQKSTPTELNNQKSDNELLFNTTTTRKIKKPTGKNQKKSENIKADFNNLFNNNKNTKNTPNTPIIFGNVNKTASNNTNIEKSPLVFQNRDMEITLGKEISDSLNTIKQTQNLKQILEANVNNPLSPIDRCYKWNFIIP